MKTLRQRTWRRLRSRQGRRAIDSRDQLHEFWRDPHPDGNDPVGYTEPVGRSAALLKLLSDVAPGASILEVGCNVGRNLAYLHDHGYQHLAGVEISEHAVRLLREHYPQLADTAVTVGSAEDVLPTLGPVDVTFTMAVLEHVHPGSTAVFDQIARLAPQLFVIEPSPETSVISHRQFPHDPVAIFERRGFALRDRQPMSAFPECDLGRYWAYRFVKI